MIGESESGDPGLRERKKMRTRAQLVEAVLELSDLHGYENTTVEQIADAVNVSPRTFARYFPSKDSAILSLLDSLTEAVNTELAVVPAEVPPLEALFTANVAMLRRAVAGAAPMPIDRITTLLRIVNSTPSLQRLAIELRTQETCGAMARRLNTAAGDRNVQLISAVWTSIITNAWGTLGTAAGPVPVTAENLAEVMKCLLVETFAEFAEASRDLTPGVT